MAFAKTQVYEMDRRKLLKLTGAMGIGAAFVMPDELLAQGICEKLVIDNGEFKATQAGATMQFWIDGLHFGDRSDVKSRANITLFMDLSQTAVSHVESVVLMDPDKKTMGARYFDSSMKMLDGHVPYVRFENVELDHRRSYYCVYTVRSGSTVKLYTAEIKNPEVSRLNTTWLPQKMRDDFKTFLVGNTANPTPGLITTQFQFYTLNGLTNHCARGRVVNMASDGASFDVNIDFMHPDGGRDHYMRYFIVMDPVGRLLGFHKREFGDPTSNGGANQTWNVKAIGTDMIKDPAKAGTADKDKLYPRADVWGVPRLQIANIADCPYIQFYTEDSYDAIARNMIRLR